MTKPFMVKAGSGQFAFVDPPTVLYKFVDKEEHAQDLVERGTLLLGTLQRYRNLEGFDPARGDAGEGRFTITLQSAQPESITADNAPWYLKEQVAGVGLPIFSHGGQLNAVGTYPDSFIFCTSYLRAADLVKRYGPYCVKIHHVVGFFAALSRHLTDGLGIASTMQFGMLGWCQYDGRSTKASSVSDVVERPAVPFAKMPDKSGELEVRAVWYPANPPPLPVIVTCSELTAFCSRVQ